MDKPITYWGCDHNNALIKDICETWGDFLQNMNQNDTLWLIARIAHEAMQDILHTAIIALPVSFATLMILDLISNLKQLWIACKPSTPVSIPVSIPQPLPEVAAPATELEELETVPDPWELEPSMQPITTTKRLTLVPTNLLLLPPAKSRIEVLEVAEPVVASTPKRRGRPRKVS